MDHFYMNIGQNDWFTYPKLYSEIVQKFPTNSHFVEVGVWEGKSAAYMAVEILNSGKQIRFDCVDIWQWYPEQKDIGTIHFDNRDIFEEFKTNLAPVLSHITPIKMWSHEAAALYPDHSLDFVFIDAAHDYDNVRKDIQAWVPKVKESGIIAGHDYFGAEGVRAAVDEFFTSVETNFEEGYWLYNF